jgi:alpha-beta hydrolase superfamily lysophospholipase
MRFRTTAVIAAAMALLLLGCSGPPYLPARTVPPTPQAPASVDHASDFLAASDRTALFEQWWRPAGKPRAVVVVVHGLKDHSSRYAELAEHLASRGIAVYALDLRGHGHSAGVRVGVNRFEDYLDDLDVLVQHVREREPGVPLFVFGHSMGGAIVTLWTIGRSPDLSGLVLSGPALHSNVSPIKVAATRFIAWIAPGAGVFQLDLDDFSRDPEVVRACKSDPLVYQDGAPAHTAATLLDAIDEIDSHMSAVRVPLLAMHGSADRVTDPEGSRLLVERAASKDKTLVVWPGLVHDLVHEPERARVIDAIVNWVDARAPH